MSLRRLALVLLAAIAATLGIGVAVAAAKIVAFQSPSHGIGCMYFSAADGQAASVRCDVTDVEHPAKRPASCEGDYGSAFELPAKGRARRLCVGDTTHDPNAKVLRYGATRHLGPFTCTSRKTGMRCVTGAGHGFDLSRQRQRLF